MIVTLPPKQALAHAASRFGFGGRPDQPLTGDPMIWLSQQLAVQPAVAGPNLDTCLTTMATYGRAPQGSAAQAQAGQALMQLLAEEQQAYLSNAITTTTPFFERLVFFWANHFAIQVDSPPTCALAGTFVRDVIRANMGGTFSQLLQAAIQHPALVYSLSNEQSAGPKSAAALHGYGFNENLGRETLELFTVGIEELYSQADVDAMSFLLTGITVNLSSHPYGALYRPFMAQPGSSTLLGQTFRNTLPGCMSALHMLGTKPATYVHLATKLATHFISDQPRQADIDTIASALSWSGGSLFAAAHAVLSCTNAWIPLAKLRTPQDYLIAIMRAANITAATAPALPALASAIGEPVWQPPFPNGWSDLASAWSGPAQLNVRLQCACSLAAKMPDLHVGEICAATVGPLLSAHTEAALNAASGPAEQLVILFTSPEFQRR